MILSVPQIMRAASIRCGRSLMTILVSSATLATVLAVGLLPRTAASLPLYARQTGQPCATCHTAFLELTPFGRRFKLGGYTLGGGDWNGPPFAVMLQPTFTNTQGSQPGGAAPGLGVNNNFVMQQMSLFTGGAFTENLGAFIQGTFDGVTRRFSWDNTDIRFAKSINLDGHTLLWGVTANNNPTVQDVWNTIPAWSFPYISSELAPIADRQHLYRASLRATSGRAQQLRLPGRSILFGVRRLSTIVEQHAAGPWCQSDRAEPDQRRCTLLAGRGRAKFW